MKRTLRLTALISALVMLSGCATIGPKIAKEAQYPYNEAIAHSWKEQMLLNLVRLRYMDTPYFLEVNSVVASHNLNIGSEIQTSFPGITNDKSTSAKLKFDYGERPTITYNPLQGSAFAKRLMSSISSSDVKALVQSGWDIDRVFDICVQRINEMPNAPAAAGPTPSYSPEYREFAELTQKLRFLERHNLLILEDDPNHDPTKFRVLVDPGKTLFMQIEPSTKYQSVIDDVYRTLDLDPSRSKHMISGNLLKPRDGKRLRMKRRTLLGVLFYLSHGVHVPEADYASGAVQVTLDENGNFFDWDQVIGRHFKVLNSKKEPKCASVKVCYRGNWFYIDDSDLNSKATFMLVSKLFNLRSRSGGGSMPALTIPVTP